MATAREENGKFCIPVGYVTSTVGILSWLKALVANWAGQPANLCGSLIGFHPRRLKGLQGMSCLTTALDLCGIFFFYQFIHSFCSLPSWRPVGHIIAPMEITHIYRVLTLFSSWLGQEHQNTEGLCLRTLWMWSTAHLLHQTSASASFVLCSFSVATPAVCHKLCKR